jgi:hypothetical protein
MPLPTGWPPRVATSIRSIRVYLTGTATAAFADNAFLFSQATSANTFIPTPYVPPGQESAVPGWTPTVVPAPPFGGGAGTPGEFNTDPRLNPPIPPPPTPMIWSKSIKITNSGGAILFFSFDGVNIHGQVAANSVFWYWDRYEAGIALQGSTAFVIEAW